MYAVRDYHDQPLQFINTIYFHTKTEGDRHYDTVVTIWILVVALKISLLFLMACLSFHYIISTSAKIMQKLKRIHTKVTDSFLSDLEKAAASCEEGTLTIGRFSENDELKCKPKVFLTELTADSVRTLSLNDTKEHMPNVYLIKLEEDTHNDIEQKLSEMKQQGVANIKHFFDSNNKKEVYVMKLPDKNKWKLDIPSVIFVNIIIYTLGIPYVHISSIVESFHYSNEVLKVNDTVIADAIFAGGFFLFVLICFLYKWILSRRHNKMCRSDCLVVIAAELVALNITYIVSYFMPYMFLAFIFDPLLTVATYFFLVLNILSLYFFASHFIKIKELAFISIILQFFPFTIKVFISILLRVIGAIAFFLFAAYVTVVFKLILDLVSFDDFKVAQSLLLPLAIASTGYIIVKPAYKKIKQKIDL